MPSDRTPSQAEIEAATDALDAIDGAYRDPREWAQAALSAAATARPAGCNQCGRAHDEYENIESRAHRWEGIARELYEALDIADAHLHEITPEHMLTIENAMATYRASLGEGEGGR